MWRQRRGKRKRLIEPHARKKRTVRQSLETSAPVTVHRREWRDTLKAQLMMSSSSTAPQTCVYMLSSSNSHSASRILPIMSPTVRLMSSSHVHSIAEAYRSPIFIASFCSSQFSFSQSHSKNANATSGTDFGPTAVVAIVGRSCCVRPSELFVLPFDRRCPYANRLLLDCRDFNAVSLFLLHRLASLSLLRCLSTNGLSQLLHRLAPFETPLPHCLSRTSHVLASLTAVLNTFYYTTTVLPFLLMACGSRSSLPASSNSTERKSGSEP